MREEIQRIREIDILGKKVPVKNYVCSKNGCAYCEKKEPIRLQFSICPTNYCDGHCPFCAAAKTNHEKGFLDVDKLSLVLEKLHEEDRLRGITFTGGEPLTDVALLNEIINRIFAIFGEMMEVSIHTNGAGIEKLHKIEQLSLVDNVHISRHHYDDARNRRYFGTDVATGNMLKEMAESVSDPHIFVYNCLLLADGIGTKEELCRFLDFAAYTGVPKVGFITPMPVNDYVKKNMVSYEKLFDRRDERFLFTTSYEDFEFCHCQDGVYVTEDGKLQEFYGRETMYGCGDYARGLVYTADNRLCTGYGKDATVIAAL